MVVANWFARRSFVLKTKKITSTFEDVTNMKPCCNFRDTFLNGRRLFLFLVTSFAWFFTTTPAHSTGAMHLEHCKQAIRLLEASRTPRGATYMDGFGAGHCAGVVKAVMTLANARGDQNFACLPKNVLLRQGLRIMVRYLTKHPDKLHLDLTTLSITAISEAFPCPKQRLTPGPLT
jgi:hypothetical protein